MGHLYSENRCTFWYLCLLRVRLCQNFRSGPFSYCSPIVTEISSVRKGAFSLNHFRLHCIIILSFQTSSRKLKSSDEVYGSKNSKNSEVVRITQACVCAWERVLCRECLRKWRSWDKKSRNGGCGSRRGVSRSLSRRAGDHFYL